MVGRPLQFDEGVAVDAAMNIFWQKGYAVTTPQELADVIGIGKGSLYNTFKSKVNLLSLALCRYSENRLAALAEVLDRDDPIRDRISSALAMLIGLGVHRHGCFAVNSMVELAPRGGDLVREPQRLFDGIEKAFERVVKHGQETGELSADVDAAAQASLLLATVMGASVLMRSNGDLAQLRRVLAAAVAKL